MKLLLAISTLLILVGTVWAQEEEFNGAYIDQLVGENTLTLNKAIQENDVFLLQTGHLNTVVISQRHGLTGANMAWLQQHGALEQIMLTQSGSNNQANFLQVGRENAINVNQQGKFISSTIYQFGTDNYVFQELGRDNTDYTVIQTGYNWGVIDKGFSPNNPGYTIKQTGMVGVTITIEHH